MPKPVYVPSGYDPTREEFPLKGCSCTAAILIAIVIGSVVLAGVAIIINVLPKASAPVPTVAEFPTEGPTHTLEATLKVSPTITPSRAKTQGIPPAPKRTIVPITATSRPTLAPSATSFTPSPTLTLTIRASATRKPSPTKKPAASTGNHTGSAGGSGGNPPPPQPPAQPTKDPRPWEPLPAAPVTATPLPSETFTPSATDISTAIPTVLPSETPTSTLPPSATIAPTLTAIPSETPTELPTQTPLPSETPTP